MIRSHTLIALASLCALALSTGCGGSTPPAATPDPASCTPAECGPEPTGRAERCADGRNMSGPTGRCLRDAAGACQHEVLTCPASETPAAPAARACGGMVAGQPACLENEFCDFPVEATCGAADAPGVCRTRPEACTMDYSPVCGCNDQTYPNACAAAAAGISVGALGECPVRAGAVGDVCGTRGAPACGEGLFCNFPAGADCGRADAPGACAERPTTCETRARRVCGCDATTYTNACAANLAGVSVETNGACRAR